MVAGDAIKLVRMPTDPLLQVLRHKARFTDRELADLLSMTPEAVAEQIALWEKDGTILGYHAVVDTEHAGDTSVSAFIEVKVTPERGGGFDRLALRISRFDQVVSCYLASGGYGLCAWLPPSCDFLSRFFYELAFGCRGSSLFDLLEGFGHTDGAVPKRLAHQGRDARGTFQ